MFLMFSFSKRTRLQVRASMVLVFSHQSLRRLASLALSWAAFAYSVALSRVPLPALVARRSCLRIRARSLTVSWGQFSFRPSERAAVMLTPRSMPMTSPVPGTSGPPAEAGAEAQSPAPSAKRLDGATVSGLLTVLCVATLLVTITVAV